MYPLHLRLIISAILLLLLPSLFFKANNKAAAWDDIDGFLRNDSYTCSPRLGPGLQIETDKKNLTCDTACQCADACLVNEDCIGFNVPAAGGWCLVVAFYERCALAVAKSWTFFRRKDEAPGEIDARLTTTQAPSNISTKRGVTSANPPTDWQYHTGCRCLCLHDPSPSTRATTKPVTRRVLRRAAGVLGPPPLFGASSSTTTPLNPGIALLGGGRLISSCPIEEAPPAFLLAQYPDFMPTYATTPRTPGAIARIYSKRCRCFCNANN